MTLQARRVITGHDANGRAIVTINEVCKNVTSDAKSVEAGGKVLPAVG